MSKDGDLFDYPDLSDEDENNQDQPLPNSQPQKIVKPNEGTETAQAAKPVFSVPKLFGGKNFFPPPPPPGKRPVQSGSMTPPPMQKSNSSSNRNNYQQPQSSNYTQPNNYQAINYPQANNYGPSNAQSRNEQPPRVQRERKNCVYVRNIPRHYNQVDKLMTFFKNEGAIREIKANLQENSAVVRFIKEETANKFVNSGKDIFNRSFIVYSLNEKDIVPENLVRERENQESGKNRKPEIEMRILKERLENQLADRLRALLFIRRNVLDGRIAEQANIEIGQTIALKQACAKYTQSELVEVSANINTDYDWSLNFKISRDREVEKKSVIFELQKKYGCISVLELTPLFNEAPPSGPYDYTVKMTLLGVKQSWQIYCHMQDAGEFVYVEGIRMRELFNGEQTRPVRIPPPTKQEEDDNQLVEICDDGQIMALVEGVIRQQVDKPEEMGQAGQGMVNTETVAVVGGLLKIREGEGLSELKQE